MEKNAGHELPADYEIEAMAVVSRALGSLDPEVRARVLRWAAERYGLGRALGAATQSPPTESTSASGGHPGEIADLFDAANPATQSEKVLIVGYWLQEVLGHPELEAQEINDHLKHLGHGILNITMALNDLKVRKPRLVIQTRKGGTSKQARKRYRLTTEGIRRARSMVDRGLGAAVEPPAGGNE